MPAFPSDFSSATLLRKVTLVPFVLFSYATLLCCLLREPHSPFFASAGKTCSSTLSAAIPGPFWEDVNINSANVRGNLSYGVPLNLTILLLDARTRTSQCVPLANAKVDIWHCNYAGLYSDEPKSKRLGQRRNTLGRRWLRGYQLTNESGYATFHTIYPGWYPGRTVHVHVRVRLYEDDNSTTSYDDTTQLYFDDTITDAINTHVYPYNARAITARKITNRNDWIYTRDNLISITGNYNDSSGYRSHVIVMSVPFAHISS